MKVAVLGVGHLMHHVVAGIMRADKSPEIHLSARSNARAQDLAKRFDLKIEPDNSALVDWADVVILAVRPFDIKEVATGLPWRADQTVVSFAATVGVSVIEPLINGAKLVLGMPNVAAEFGESTTVIYPENERVRTLMEPCGTVIAVETEKDYETASLFGAYYGWTQALIGEMALWAEGQGLDAETARDLVASMTRSGATGALLNKGISVPQMVEDLSLPGSLTGDGVAVLKDHKAFDPWRATAEKILKRIQDE